MASSASSPWEILDRRSNGLEILVHKWAQLNNTLPQLSSVKSCAMLGCGYSYIDLEFVCRHLPNVKKLTAVEPDADQMAALKTRVSQLLPHVSIDFCQETAQSWRGADQPFDAVLLFHCLYYVPQLERPALFKKLFDNVLSNGGLVFTLVCSCNLENPTMVNRLFDLLRLSSYGFVNDIDGVQVRDTMTSVGFRDCYQLPIEYQVDAEEPNDDLMSVFVYWSQGTLSLEYVREAAKQVLGSEKCLHDDVLFGVFEKP